MSITPYTNYILNANYGDDVRDSIVNALNECYKDATGNNNSIASLVQQYMDRDDAVGAAVAALTGLYGEVGEYIVTDTTTSSVSMATSTYVNFGSLTLSPGVWLVVYGGEFSLNSTGYRWINLTPDSSSPASGTRWTSSIDGNSSRTVNIIKSRPMMVNETTTYYLFGWQNSGSTLTGWPILCAIKIKGEELEEGNPLYNQLVSNSQAIQTLQTKQSTDSAAISSLQVRHLNDMRDIEEDIAGNVSILSSRIADLENADRVITGDVDGMQEIVQYINGRRFILDENGYLQIQNSSEYVTPEEQVEIEEVVTDWLNDHPEATTTVVDGAIDEDKLSTSVKNNLSDLQTQITTNNTARINEIAVERARIDELVALPEGTSALDAEVIDLRRDVDNYVHGTAGVAVRFQVNTLISDINSTNLNLDTLSTQVSSIPVIHYYAKSFTFSGAGWAKILLPDGSSMTYPTYKVLNCYTATEVNGVNVLLNTTIDNSDGINYWWMKSINGTSLEPITNCTLSVEVAYIQI